MAIYVCDIHGEYISRAKTVRCPPCWAEYMKNIERDPKRIAHKRDLRFGLKPGEWEWRLYESNYCCPICGDEFEDDNHNKKPCLDHDHECCNFRPTSAHPLCGKCTRDVICWECNILLGKAHDEVKRLEGAIQYLFKWHDS